MRAAAVSVAPIANSSSISEVFGGAPISDRTSCGARARRSRSERRQSASACSPSAVAQTESQFTIESHQASRSRCLVTSRGCRMKEHPFPSYHSDARACQSRASPYRPSPLCRANTSSRVCGISRETALPLGQRSFSCCERSDALRLYTLAMTGKIIGHHRPVRKAQLIARGLPASLPSPVTAVVPKRPANAVDNTSRFHVRTHPPVSNV